MTPPIEVLINCYMICVLINYVPLSFVSYLWYFELTKRERNDDVDEQSIIILFTLALIPIVNIFTGGLHVYGIIDTIVHSFKINFKKNGENNRNPR